MLTAQEENRMAKPGILLPNCTVDLSRVTYFEPTKNPEKKYLLNGVRLFEDFTHNDLELRKKAFPMMKRAFKEGKKVRFTKRKLLFEGNAFP